MTLAELKHHADRDGEFRDGYAEVRRLIGEAAAIAVRTGDRQTLERAARAAGTYRALVDAARRAGVDPDALEEALAAI